MHGAHNTCECMHTLRKNAYGLVPARLCNGAEASLPWKLLRTYLESCASIVLAEGTLEGRMISSNMATNGIKKITGKYNTSKLLTEVKISCPCGLKWTWKEDVSSLIEQEREERTTSLIKECTKNLRTHSLKLSQQGMEIRLEALADMLPLIQATHNSPQDLGTRSVIYDIGPWKRENLLAGIEIFFQKNAYHPFAICGYLECGKTDPIPMYKITDNTTSGQPLPTRSIEHFCEGKTCFRTDPTNFCSTTSYKG